MRTVAAVILLVAALAGLRWLMSTATWRSWSASLGPAVRRTSKQRSDPRLAGMAHAAAGIVERGAATLDRAGDRESELLIERWGRLVSPRGDIERDRPVLVVEDDDDVREMLRIGLETDGFETAGAPDGRDALQMATETPPQAILLDLELPHVSGGDFIKQWREDSSAVADSVPVVVVSGSKDAASIAEAIGADAVVKKPVDLDQLSTLLHELTDPPSAAATDPPEPQIPSSR